MILNRIRCVVPAALGFFLTVGTASAHHLMGGKIPSTFAEGILSGVGHPIIGPDHFAFLLAMGIAVGVAGLSFVNLFLFLVAMAWGVATHVSAATVLFAELIVALSVLVAGILLVLERRVPAVWWMALFLIAGFFHGYAYGESIYGAEATPLAAYLVGLVAVQTTLALSVALVTRAVWTLPGVAPRLAGAAICGVGFTVLVAQIIPTP